MLSTNNNTSYDFFALDSLVNKAQKYFCQNYQKSAGKCKHHIDTQFCSERSQESHNMMEERHQLADHYYNQHTLKEFYQILISFLWYNEHKSNLSHCQHKSPSESFLLETKCQLFQHVLVVSLTSSCLVMRQAFLKMAKEILPIPQLFLKSAQACKTLKEVIGNCEFNRFPKASEALKKLLAQYFGCFGESLKFKGGLKC